ncbi:phage/plasmid primase, P4 family [bacterium]|nr:phage/plasmid primase, P4 family [bacterium]
MTMAVTAVGSTDALAVLLTSIPEALKQRRAWVCWRYETRGGKQTKVPYIAQPGPLRKARSNTPDTWRPFTEAVRQAPRFDGIGVMLSDDLAGADLDNSLDDGGKLKPWAEEIVRELDSYTETSPSGKGVKVFFFGEVPPGGNRKKLLDGELESYSRGRFFTVTGNHFAGTPPTVEERQAQLEALHRRVFGSKSTRQAAAPASGIADVSDEELLAKARQARNGDEFARLWDGGYPDDDSAGDLALCCHLAFWTGGDPLRIDRLVRQSGRMRDKWEREDYRERTIAKARESTTQFYTPRGGISGGSQQARTSTGSERDLLRFHATDAGNGELFASLFGDRLRFDWKRERWLKWGTHLWEDAAGDELIRFAKEAARARYEAASAADSDAQRKWAFGSESKSRIEAALHLARSEPPIADAGEAWDRQPMLLGCPNGVIELGTGAFRRGSREDYLTQSVSVPYTGGAECPRWRQFVREVFDDDGDLVRFVWRAVGYSLTGSTKEQCFFLLHGKGANGKSVFLSILRYVLGDYAHNASFQLFDYASRNDHTQSLALLELRRFVTASEAAENARLNEDRLKALAGSDPITARLMRENDRTFENMAKVWLGVNHRPRVLDETDGFWRKARLIPFNRQFLGDDADRNLSDKLKAEAAGILRWAVQGATEWAREGLTPPATVLAASTAWREEADPLGEFLASCCAVEPTCQASAGDLYREYSEWCDELRANERERLSSTAFGRRMADRFSKQRVTKAGRKMTVYSGVGLQAPPQTDTVDTVGG